MCIKNWFKNLFNPINRLSDDDRIRKALQLVSPKVIDAFEYRSVKIKWDSSLASNVFACRAVDSFGNNFILINYRYKRAPIEQIACLLVHESCHVKDKADFEEEVYATSEERLAWRQLKKDITYEETPLYLRLEKISKMSYNEVMSYIEESNFYEEVLKVV